MKIHTSKSISILHTLSGCAIALLASCGDYSAVTPTTFQQKQTKMSGFAARSGKPALRTPARIGIMHTSRTDALDLASAEQKLKASGTVISLQPVNAVINVSHDYYQLTDVMAKKAKLLHDVEFLGLDVILVCDQMIKNEEDDSFLQIFTLGLIDAGRNHQNTQLSVMCMDARTGYVYGMMGQGEEGATTKLSLLDLELLGDPQRSHLVKTSRRDAEKQLPEFWQQIVSQYRKR